MEKYLFWGILIGLFYKECSGTDNLDGSGKGIDIMILDEVIKRYEIPLEKPE